MTDLAFNRDPTYFRIWPFNRKRLSVFSVQQLFKSKVTKSSSSGNLRSTNYMEPVFCFNVPDLFRH